METFEAHMDQPVSGRLEPCPESPNCVISVGEDASHFIEPFSYFGDRGAARKRLLSILVALPRTRIRISDDGNYIQAECRSFLFRFVDDLEFVMDTEKPLIHVRSAARTGYSDFGVNRKRVEQIRKAFMEGSPQ